MRLSALLLLLLQRTTESSYLSLSITSAAVYRHLPSTYSEQYYRIRTSFLLCLSRCPTGPPHPTPPHPTPPHRPLFFLFLNDDQRDQIWRFLRVLDSKWITKVAQIFGELFVGFLKRITFKVKTVVVTFSATLEKFWLFLIYHLVTLMLSPLTETN